MKKFLLILQNILQAAENHDLDFNDLMRRRGITFSHPLQFTSGLTVFFITLIVGSPILLLTYLSIKLKSEIVLVIAAILTILLIVIPVIAILCLTVIGIKHYFARRRMIARYQLEHPNR